MVLTKVVVRMEHQDSQGRDFGPLPDPDEVKANVLCASEK